MLNFNTPHLFFHVVWCPLSKIFVTLHPYSHLLHFVRKLYMKRDESWQSKYDAIWTFVSENHRGPSRHHLEEKRMLNWLKYNRKILNKGVLSPEKTDLIMRLRAYIASFNRINQYM